ncbi:MAG: hypothetical protein K9K86_04400 [Pseudomonadales bacterium]|nr:hypothetical protein [Pseudomonadales bacterium]
MEKPSTQAEFYSNLESLRASFNARGPELEVTIRDPDLNLEGFIVVWNTAISKNGPLPLCGKGGTRIREGLSLDEVKMLARKMSVKNAAAGLPLGGSKSGINANPKSPGFEQKYRRFVELCKPFLHENGGIFGGFGFDIGAAPEHAVWACDTLGSTSSFTGKPVEMGGTDYDKEGIAGLGVAESAATIIKIHNGQLDKTHFAVHGVGAMGAAVIRYFSEYGAHLCAIGDPKYTGTWRFEKDISNELLTALINQQVEKAQALLAIEGRLVSDNPDDVLFESTDVLFPCALHSVITANNTPQLKTRYIVEGANNPCEFETFPLLLQQGIHLIPDFIANSGGVISAFIELTSDVDIEENIRTRAKAEQAKVYTRTKIRDNVTRIEQCSQAFKVPFRDASLYVALDNILNANQA